MFNFHINSNATIEVTLTDGNPGPRTTMYYPCNGVVDLGVDSFTVDGKLYMPVVENAPYGPVIRINH